MRPIDADKVIVDLTAMQEVYDAIALDGMIRGLKRQETISVDELAAFIRAGQKEQGRSR